jgi:hypothetical protein
MMGIAASGDRRHGGSVHGGRGGANVIFDTCQRGQMRRSPAPVLEVGQDHVEQDQTEHSTGRTYMAAGGIKKGAWRYRLWKYRLNRDAVCGPHSPRSTGTRLGHPGRRRRPGQARGKTGKTGRRDPTRKYPSSHPPTATTNPPTPEMKRDETRAWNLGHRRGADPAGAGGLEVAEAHTGISGWVAVALGEDDSQTDPTAVGQP